MNIVAMPPKDEETTYWVRYIDAHDNEGEFTGVHSVSIEEDNSAIWLIFDKDADDIIVLIGFTAMRITKETNGTTD